MPNLRRSAKLLGAACGFLALLLAPAMAQAASELVYVSTYRAPPPPGQPPVDRDQNGIFAARLDTKTGRLTALGLQAKLDRATWLVTHPSLPVIYSVADSGGGITTEAEVHSFVMDRATGALKPLNKTGSGGRDATHMTIDAGSKTLFAANHDSGEVTALPLLPDGSLSPVASTQKDVGTGPHPRQNRPQPHFVVMDPSHRYLLTNDFGADRIFVRRFDGATHTLAPANTPIESTPPGTGPRHLAFHPNGKFFYVNTEVGSTVIAYRWDAAAARMTPIQTLPLWPADYTGTVVKSSAEIGISRDGRFLYVSLRGDQDSIVVYAVDPAAGTLKEIQRIASQGHIPRSFAIDPTGRWMLVANEGSNSVAVLSIDRATGKLGATGQSIAAPTPVAFAFAGH